MATKSVTKDAVTNNYDANTDTFTYSTATVRFDYEPSDAGVGDDSTTDPLHLSREGAFTATLISIINNFPSSDPNPYGSGPIVRSNDYRLETYSNRFQSVNKSTYLYNPSLGASLECDWAIGETLTITPNPGATGTGTLAVAQQATEGGVRSYNQGATMAFLLNFAPGAAPPPPPAEVNVITLSTCTPVWESIHVYLNGVEQYQPEDWYLRPPDGVYPKYRVQAKAAMDVRSGDLLEARYVCALVDYVMPAEALVP